MSVAAMLCAAAAAALVFGSVRPQGHRTAGGVAGRVVAVLALVAAALWVASAPVHTLLLAGSGAAAALVMARLLHDRRRLVTARRRSEQVLLACESISGDLSVGLAHLVALERVARAWEGFAPVAAAARLDADVALELRRLARLPGAGELANLAAAWQVAQRSGAALAPTLAAITDVVRADAATARLVETELAAARATAALLVALPVGVLLLGQGIGARPWHFLSGSGFGVVCVVLGVALDLAGVWWLQRIAARVLRS